jgi:Tat protein translocase TatB subunit
MFGLGLTEIMVILVVALLFIGPEKLPEVAKSLGRGLRELRKVTDDVRDTVNTTVVDAVKEVARRPDTVAKAATETRPKEDQEPPPASTVPAHDVAVGEERVPQDKSGT